VRLIGGQAYWSYGLEVVRETVKQTGATLIVIPGDERPDPTLISHSTAALATVNQVWQYFIEAGVENYQNLLKFVAKQFLHHFTDAEPPQPVPRVGIYPGDRTLDLSQLRSGVGIIFYQAHYLAGNTAAIDALCQALAAP
jgi:cobaltochelatase CobN